MIIDIEPSIDLHFKAEYHSNDFSKQRYTTPYLAMVIVFFNHKAYGKMALLVMIHIKS